jgi:hypothetical protein
MGQTIRSVQHFLVGWPINQYQAYSLGRITRGRGPNYTTRKHAVQFARLLEKKGFSQKKKREKKKEVTTHQWIDFCLCYSRYFSKRSEQDTCTWNQKWLLHIRLITVCVLVIFFNHPKQDTCTWNQLVRTTKKPKNSNDFSDRRKTISWKKKQKPTIVSVNWWEVRTYKVVSWNKLRQNI